MQWANQRSSRRKSCAGKVAQSPQLSLAIEMGDTAAKRTTSRASARNALHTTMRGCVDELLSTREIVRITGKHRSTVLRWMSQGLFPDKAKIHGLRLGWRRSDIERWLQGDSDGEPMRGARDKRGT